MAQLSPNSVSSEWLPRLCLWLGVTILVATPCYWFPHIPSLDYPSHLYNAWLVQQLQTHPVAGLSVTPMWTNVLVDWILGLLTSPDGSVAGEFVVPVIAVLTFFWGSFYWIQQVVERSPWGLSPVLAMLCYGAVFHLGFLNHFMSAGICLWILGLVWRPSPRRLGLAAGLAVVALLAHPLPLFWAAAILLYVGLARLTPADLRAWLLVAAILMLAVLREFVMETFPSRSVWDVDSLGGILLGMVGTEQFWLFGTKYVALAIFVALAGAAMLWHRWDDALLRERTAAEDARVHLWVLHAAAFLLIPASVQLPQYRHALAFLPDRISLWGALALCLALADTAAEKRAAWITAPVAAVFFSFLFVDHAMYNTVQAQVESLVKSVPAQQRVVGPLLDADARIPVLQHVVDLACRGTCWSYANYEPATDQFRVRASAPNRMVAWSMADVQDMERGEFVVRAADEPVYSICACSENHGSLCLKRISTGGKTCSTTMRITPRWWALTGVPVTETE